MNHAHLKYKISGFTLLELLVVAAIIAVIAAFTIPGYINYITQTRVNALWQEAEEAKLQVESIYLKKNTPINTITVDSGTAEYTTTNTSFVQCITVQDGTVSVVGKPSYFDNKTIWISWQPTVTAESITWSCTYSTDAAQYVTDISNTCGVQNCQQYTSWNTATTVDTETFWYFGNLTQDEVSTAFANNCNTIGTMSGCADCYNFVNTNTEQRYMTFSLTNTTYDYQGALGSNPNWSSYSSWAYQYPYTIVTQSCMDQTRTASSCTNTEPFASDPAC